MMYLDHFGLTEAPFTITPHTEFFFAGANRGATLEALIYAITHGEGIVKVSGEVGSGKTMLCRVLMERLPEWVETIYLAIPSLDRDEMLAAICADLGVAAAANDAPGALLKRLQEHLLRLHAGGRRVVALIDEAHAMPLDSLEEIRLLSNLETSKSKLLQIVLFGQPELDDKLAKPQMRQLRERITHSFRLSPLSLEDIQEYLRHRLSLAGYKGAEVFSPACVKLIARASAGLTRRVNIVADKSLLAAYSANTHSVGRSHVRAAIRDSEFINWQPDSRRTRWLMAGALAVGFVIGGLVIGAVGSGWLPQRGAAARGAAVTGLLAPISDSAVRPFNPAALSGKAAAPAAETAKPLEAPVTSIAAAPVKPIAAAPASRKVGANSAVFALGLTQTAPVAPLEPLIPAHASSMSERLVASDAWLAAQDGSHWVIQLLLANASEAAPVAAFIEDAGSVLEADRIHAYRSTVNRTEKVGVVYGGFAQREAAQQTLNSLPDKIRLAKPYLRTIAMVRAEAGAEKKPQ